MVEISRILNIRPSGQAQLNISVRSEIAQEVANALASLMRLEENLGHSKSEIVCEAIIAYAGTKQVAADYD
ncbi:MAG: hypothetical protein KKA73_16980 [Chloroflexi bacterium]|nr:hypothetical protein [Chloroflexota bacterium]MBU1749382.1 hypothetical protein [Chloroflexota bacterium]